MGDEMFKGINDRKRTIKENKRNKNRRIFDIKNKESDFNIIKEYNGTIHFEYLEDEFYFYEVSGKVRMKGENEYYPMKTF